VGPSITGLPPYYSLAAGVAVGVAVVQVLNKFELV